MNNIIGSHRKTQAQTGQGGVETRNQTGKSGSLQGKSITIGEVPKTRGELRLSSGETIKNDVKLLIDGKKLALGQPPQVPMGEGKVNAFESLRMVRTYNAMMQTINRDPVLKEVMGHIDIAQTTLVEMMGMDPTTPEELEHLNLSLTTLSDKLDEAVGQLDSIDLKFDENPVRNPAPVQRGVIQHLKGMIEARLFELSETALPKTGPEQQRETTSYDTLPKLRAFELKMTGLIENGIGTLNQRAAIGEALSLIHKGLSQLDSPPGNRLQIGSQLDRLAPVLERLDSITTEVLDEFLSDPGAKEVKGELKTLLDSARNEFRTHKDALVTASGLNPLSTKAIFHSKTFSTIGAQNLLKSELSQAKENYETLWHKGASRETLAEAKTRITVLENAITFLDQRLDQLRSGNNDLQIDKADVAGLMGSHKADKGIKDEGIAERLRSLLEHKVDLTSDQRQDPLMKSSADLREDGIMQVFVGYALEKAGLEVPGNLREILQERRFEALNTSDWKPISKQVVLRHEGQTHAMTSEVVPQSQLGEHFSDMKGGGVVCHAARNFEHGTTVAVSRLTAPDGTKLFEGVRHGIVNCYGISTQTLHKLEEKELAKLVQNLLPDSQWKRDEGGNPSLSLTMAKIKSSKGYRHDCARLMQDKGSEMRALDLVATNLVKNTDKLNLALAESKKPNPTPVEINLNSIALVTPDLGRVIKVKGQSSPQNERKMLAGQMKALRNMAGDPQPRELKIKNAKGEETTVLVDIKVNAFNFGVNAGAFGVKNSRFLRAILPSGWGTSDRLNRAPMERLIGPKSSRKDGNIGGQVGDWLEANAGKVPQKTLDNVRKLASQVGMLWDTKAHHRANFEPYKMVSRLAVLTSMIGGDTCWNCKSGKDRTGQLDVEAKRLAAEIWMQGDVPEPDVEPDEDIKSNRFRMAMDGGNLELQNYNTGAPGFKLTGVPALEEQLNDSSKNLGRYTYFTGIAGFYGT